jgi:hypothetical protein
MMMMMMTKKPLTEIIMGLLTAVALGVFMTEAYAQQNTTTNTNTTLTATTQQIIDEAHAACTQVTQAEVLNPICVTVVYESPTTLVLVGDLLVVQFGGGYGGNPFIWQAVDGFKAQGYTLHSVLLSGQGTQVNPHEWYIVMSK